MDMHDAADVLGTLISSTPILQRLALASIELVCFAVAAAVFIRLARIRSARLVYLLWLVVLVKPIISLAFGSPISIVLFEQPVTETVAIVEAEPLPLLQSPLVEWPPVLSEPVFIEPETGTVVLPAPEPAGRTWPRWLTDIRLPQAILAAWLAGVGLFALRYLLGRFHLHRIIRRSRPPSRLIATRCHNIAAQLHVKRIPRLRVTDQLESPAMAGLFKPTILIPAWLADDADAGPKLDWSLRHELTHCRWFDPLAVFVRDLAVVLFYFHPVAWWSSRRLVESMELACDRAMVDDASDATDYADQLCKILTQIRDRRRRSIAGGLFATRTQIGKRIAALLDASFIRAPQLTALSLIAVLIAAAVTLTVGAGVGSEKAGDTSESLPQDGPHDSAPVELNSEAVEERTSEPPVDTLQWRKAFDAVYRLDEGDVLRRIAPPFIPERLDYYRNEHAGQADAISDPPDHFTFHWDGELHNWGLGFSGGKRPLDAVLRSNLGLESYELEGKEELLAVDVPGDWIVRKDASKASRLAALEQILLEQLERPIRFEKRRVQREVVVVTGQFKFARLARVRDSGAVHIYSETLDDHTGGGSGNIDELLRWVGNRLNLRLISEVEPVAIDRMSWSEHDDSYYLRMADRREELTDRVLANLARQTSLKFNRQRRDVDVWFATEGESDKSRPEAAIRGTTAPARARGAVIGAADGGQGECIIGSGNPAPNPVGASAEAEANRRVEKKLQEPMPADLRNTSLVDVIDYIRTYTGLSVDTNWAAMEEAGVSKDSPITMQLQGVSAGLVLELVLREAGGKDETNPVRYAIERGVIVISSERQLKLAGVTIRSVGDSEPTQAEHERSRRIGAELLKPISVDFQDTPLSSVIDYVRTLTRVNIYTDWRSLENIGVKQDFPISLQLQDVRIGNVLTLVLREASADNEANPLRYTVERGVVMISSYSRSRTEKVRILLYRAGKLRQEQDFDRAMELVDRALSLDPQNTAAKSFKEWIEYKQRKQRHMGSEIETDSELRQKATEAELNQMYERAAQLLESRKYTDARTAIRAARAILFRSQRFLPPEHYRQLTNKSRDLEDKIVLEMLKWEHERGEDIAARIDEVMALDPENFAAKTIKEMTEDSKSYIEADIDRRKEGRRQVLKAECEQLLNAAEALSDHHQFDEALERVRSAEQILNNVGKEYMTDAEHRALRRKASILRRTIELLRSDNSPRPNAGAERRTLRTRSPGGG